MQPQPTPPIGSAQLPLAFFAQLFARLKTESPKFYVIIQKAAIGLTVGSTVLAVIVFFLLPQAHIAVPVWLTSSQSLIAAIVGLLAGVGLGGAGVASTTIQTASTPPLATTEPKITLEMQVQQVLQQLAQTNLEMERLKQLQQQSPTVNASDLKTD